MSSSFHFISFLLSILSITVITSPTTTAVFVSTPCCYSFEHVGAAFGPRLPWTSPGVSGDLSRSRDKTCEGGIPNTIVMMDRGLESFADAVRACQAKGVLAVIVRNANNNDDSENHLIIMGPTQDRTIHIPSVFVSKKAGEELDAILLKSALDPFAAPARVELFATDDVTYLLGEISAAFAQLFSFMLFLLMFAMIFIMVKRSTRACCCRNRQSRQTIVVSSSLLSRVRGALLSQEGQYDRGLLEPLASGNGNGNFQVDVESKAAPPKEKLIVMYPVVGGGVAATTSVGVPADPNDGNEVSAIAEQQEQ